MSRWRLVVVLRCVRCVRVEWRDLFFVEREGGGGQLGGCLEWRGGGRK